MSTTLIPDQNTTRILTMTSLKSNTHDNNGEQRTRERDGGFLRPSWIHGKAEEDPELFLNMFERWCIYKNYTEKSAFPLLLKDLAYVLFDALDASDYRATQTVLPA